MLDLVCGNDPIKYDTLPCTLHIPWCILWHWSSSHIESRSRISYPVTSLVHISSDIIRIIIITFPCTYMIPYRLPNFPANDINVSVFPYLTWLLQASPWAKHVRNDEWPKDHQNRCGLKWVLQESVRIFGCCCGSSTPEIFGEALTHFVDIDKIRQIFAFQCILLINDKCIGPSHLNKMHQIIHQPCRQTPSSYQRDVLHCATNCWQCNLVILWPWD